MKETIAPLITHALQKLISEEKLPKIEIPTPHVTRTKDPSHGDWATNIAMTLAKTAKMPPRNIAELILEAIEAHPAVTQTAIAGPGFINFFVTADSQSQVVPTILEQQETYGKSTVGEGQRVQIEFVSANPTGPLHVGHGRGAAYGASLANLLEAAGYEVHREYYVNDAGRQMNILAVSVWLRYLALFDIKPFDFPEKIYQGSYVIDIAKKLKAETDNTDQQAQLCQSAKTINDALINYAADTPKIEKEKDDNGNKNGDENGGGIESESGSESSPAGLEGEALTDALIEICQQLLGETSYKTLFSAGLETILDDIRDDLAEFNVNYQAWFSEASLQSQIPDIVQQLESKGHIYEKEGAKWFRSTDFGDDKDRVVVRDNGQSTYFASDIAYHYHKYQQDYDKVINIWGADHHGYVTRVKAALEALGLDSDKLSIQLVQFAILFRGKERVQMSTRSGSFVTLRELRDEVGNDAARFFYVTRKAEQHMDFDLELAKSQSKDNPIYYIQYAHARICSVVDKVEEKGYKLDIPQGLNALSKLSTKYEQNLMTQLSAFPDTIEKAAKQYEPHSITNYLKDLASDFHTYYNAEVVLTEDADTRNARLCLSLAAKQVIANGLHLLGVSAPERM